MTTEFGEATPVEDPEVDLFLFENGHRTYFELKARQAGQFIQDLDENPFYRYGKRIGIPLASAAMVLFGGTLLIDHFKHNFNVDVDGTSWLPDNLDPHLEPHIAYANLDNTPTPSSTPTATPVRNCSPWPDYFKPALQYFSMPNGKIFPDPDGFCVIRDPQSPFTYPAYWLNAVVLGSDTLNTGMVGEAHGMLNESCKMAQDWLAKAEGFRDIGDYPKTSSGGRFAQVTGWPLSGYAGTPPQGVNFENGWGPYPNIWEDNSVVCEYWIDGYTKIVGQDSRDRLLTIAPLRANWAAQSNNLPNGTLTPTPRRSPTPEFTATAINTATMVASRTARPTPTVGLVPGRGASIGETGPNTILQWQPGDYSSAILRVGNGGAVLLPSGSLDRGLIQSSVTSFVDQLGSGLTWYQQLAVDSSGRVVARSDALGTVMFDFKQGADRNLRLRLNQSSTGTLTFDSSDSVDYLMWGSAEPNGVIPITRGSNSLTRAMTGPACFGLIGVSNGQIIDISGILCGIPNLSSFPN